MAPPLAFQTIPSVLSVTTLEPTVPKFASNKRRNLVVHTSNDKEEEVLQIGDHVMALLVDREDNLSIQSIQR
jgi:hypothetical protein